MDALGSSPRERERAQIPLRRCHEREMQVFIVDSSATLGQRLVSMLSELAGVEVIGHAQEVQAAWDIIYARRPDVVVLDIHLPGKSGLDLLKKIQRAACSAFVMVFTNDVSCLYQKKCRYAGADCLLYKPTDLKRAREIVQGLLQCGNAAVAKTPQHFPKGT
jgi:two-component system response regulator DevR